MARQSANKQRPLRRKPSRPRAKGKPKRQRGWFARLCYWSVVVGLWAAIAISAVVAYVLVTLPRDAGIALPARVSGVTVLGADGSVLARRGAFAGDDVSIDELPRYVPQAVIAIEDKRYFSHFGIDPVGLARAMIANVKAGRIVQGGSTITQQLAKNLFLKPERTLRRKAKEAVLALWLEYQYSKREILQLYLNRVYFGAGTFGVEAATQRYYNKPAASLNLAEAAVLAGLLKAPAYYAPSRHRARAEQRAYVVLNEMMYQGYITRAQGQQAVDHPAQALGHQAIANIRYVFDWVLERLPRRVRGKKGNLIIETTIDPRLQRIAEHAVQTTLAPLAKPRRVDQAALIALGRDGAVRALVGGRSYSKSQFNRAVKARRQPGSAFKPFVYLTALERGYRPDSVVEDAPVAIRGWRPKNHSSRFRGPITLREALAQSVNTVAARLAVAVGPARVAKTARRLGIRSKLHNNPSLALGTAEVTLGELTAAYVPFSNGGMKAQPYVITRVRLARKDRERVIYRRKPPAPIRVVAQRHIAGMNVMMADTLISGTGKKAALAGRPAAGKTGTSQGFRDAWFIGYTREMTAGVWAGNDNGKPTLKVTGGDIPAVIWQRFMQAAHDTVPARALPGTAPAQSPQRRPGGIARLLNALGF